MEYADSGFSPLSNAPLPPQVFILEAFCNLSQSWVAQALQSDIGQCKQAPHYSQC